MSPFSILLRQLRVSRRLKQKEMANHLGYEPSYISALERGNKGPPKQDFINRFIQGLQLTEEEQATLAQALRLSRRHISLPSRASEREYALLHQLERVAFTYGNKPVEWRRGFYSTQKHHYLNELG